MTKALLLLLAATACDHAAHHAAPAASPPPATPLADAPLTEATIAVPIKPGQTAAWQRALAELTGPRYDEYRTSRERFGLTSQVTFLQRTPMGDFAIIHLTGGDVRASFHAMARSTDSWDVQWRALTQSLHGMDFATAAPPQVEPLFSTGADSEGPMFGFALPLDASKLADVRALAAELAGPRHADYVAARARVHVTREAAFLEQTGWGDALVVFWRCADPAAALAALASSTDPFDRWLASAAAPLHPVPAATLFATVAHNELVGAFPH